jgi:hypothetical protein
VGRKRNLIVWYLGVDYGIIFFFPPMPPHVLMDFVVFRPGHGSSVTDFWGWDAHEEQLRCPDDVSGDIGGWSARRALKPKFHLPTQTMVTAGVLPFRENSHGRAGNRTRDLMINSQKLWQLDHEAGHEECIYMYLILFRETHTHIHRSAQTQQNLEQDVKWKVKYEK